jgi:hypothetical protein
MQYDFQPAVFAGFDNQRRRHPDLHGLADTLGLDFRQVQAPSPQRRVIASPLAMFR